MNILILGGTVFVGRHLAEEALRRGHRVTLFNRGKQNPDLFPALERLRGDRDGDLRALENHRWDAVLDTSGYVPRQVRASARLLADRVTHYTFISTLAVYPDLGAPDLDETAPVATLSDPSTEEVNSITYGALKALCERTLEEALPNRTLVIRPGYVIGPHDPTDRFTWWIHRIARGGEVLAPGRPHRRVQVIDVRDLADWLLRMVEHQRTGIYNTVGPASPLTMQQFLETCKTVGESDACFTWAGEEFLLAQEVLPSSEMPLWSPGKDDTANCTRAIADGLTFRPLVETIRDTLAWVRTLPPERRWSRGLKPEREAKLLAQWRSTFES